MTLGELASLAAILALALSLYLEISQAGKARESGGLERGRMMAVDERQQRDIDKLLNWRDDVIRMAGAIDGQTERMDRIEKKLDRALELWGERQPQQPQRGS